MNKTLFTLCLGSSLVSIWAMWLLYKLSLELWCWTYGLFG